MADRDWIIAYDLGHPTKPGHCECLRCGFYCVTMAPGMAINVATGAMRAFEKDHRDCQEVPA